MTEYFRYLCHRLSAIFVASAFIFLCNDPNSAAETISSTCQNDIEKIIGGIRTQEDADLRGDSAIELAGYLHDNPQCGHDMKIVNDIASLLADRDDGVRWGAAASLASIGPPAKRAVPALKKALSESDAALEVDLRKSGDTMLPTVYSGQAIREALRRITGEPIPAFDQ
jgi:HEAT repeat protein